MRHCLECNKLFDIPKYYQQKKFCSRACSARYYGRLRKQKIIRNCIHCGQEFEAQMPSDPKKFCSSSCAAKFNNQNRSKESREKQKTTLRKTISKDPKPNQKKLAEMEFQNSVVGPYTPVYLCKCALIGKLFYSDTRKKYSNEAIYSSRTAYASRAKFRFNVYHYPDSLDLTLLEKFGWYHPVKNSDGVSRDHLLSIQDGWLNNIDPKIISHPANCRLIMHQQNNTKKANSTIILEDLLQKIKNWR